MNMYLRGFRGLCASKKGVMSMMMLGVTATLAIMGKLDMSVAACLGTIQLIFCYSVAKTDIAAINEPTCNTPYQGPNE